jgi:hypothetical protein
VRIGRGEITEWAKRKLGVERTEMAEGSSGHEKDDGNLDGG